MKQLRNLEKIILGLGLLALTGMFTLLGLTIRDCGTPDFNKSQVDLWAEGNIPPDTYIWAVTMVLMIIIMVLGIISIRRNKND